MSNDCANADAPYGSVDANFAEVLELSLFSLTWSIALNPSSEEGVMGTKSVICAIPAVSGYTGADMVEYDHVDGMVIPP